MPLHRTAARRLVCGAAALAGVLASAGSALAQDATFDIDAYDVSGATLLPQGVVEGAVYPHLGPARTAADIEKARAALEQAYHSRGYQSVLVEVPEQTVSDRIVRLAVSEVTVGEVRVTGARYYSADEIRRQAPALAPGQVPDLAAAERQVAALNKNPERQVAPVLTPGRVPGTVDVELAVTDEFPLHGSLEVNNDHAAFTEDLRLSGTVRYSNVWGRGHTAFFGYTVAPERREDLEVFQGSYLAPIQGTPWTLQLSGYDSNSFLATLGGTSVLGLGYQINARAIYDLPAFGDFAHRLSFGLDYNQASLSTFVFDEEEDRLELVEAPVDVTYYPLVVDYTLNRVTERSTTGVSLSFAANLRGAADGDDEFQLNRSFARANWVKLNATIDHVQNLPDGLVGVVQVGAQAADQALVSREQFSIGGLASVRGYLQSSALGDNGVYGNLELRSPVLFPQIGQYLDEWRLYAFGDAGYVSIYDPLPEQDRSQTLASLGFGTRFVVLGRVNGDLLVGLPLKRAPEVDPGQPYGFFTLRTEF